jgi:hypothetical protein
MNLLAQVRSTAVYPTTHPGNLVIVPGQRGGETRGTDFLRHGYYRTDGEKVKAGDGSPRASSEARREPAGSSVFVVGIPLQSPCASTVQRRGRTI